MAVGLFIDIIPILCRKYKIIFLLQMAKIAGVCHSLVRLSEKFQR